MSAAFFIVAMQLMAVAVAATEVSHTLLLTVTCRSAFFFFVPSLCSLLSSSCLLLLLICHLLHQVPLDPESINPVTGEACESDTPPPLPAH